MIGAIAGSARAEIRQSMGLAATPPETFAPGSLRPRVDDSNPALVATRALGSQDRPALLTLDALTNQRTDILLDNGTLPTGAGAIALQTAARETTTNLMLEGLTGGLRAMPRMPVTWGNRVEVFTGTRDYMPRLLDDIAHATTDDVIHVAQFNWESDGAGRKVANALIERARAGVPVRITVDGYGFQRPAPVRALSLLKELEDAGAVMHRASAFGGAPAAWEHRKLISIGDHTAYMGGIGFGAKYDFWHDAMTRIEGPAAVMARAHARAAWHDVGGVVPEAELAELRTSIERAAAVVPEAGVNDAVGAVQLLENRPGIDLGIAESFIRDTQTATRRVWASSAYLTSPEAAQALMEAAQRPGMDVRLLVPHDLAGNDEKYIRLGRTFHQDLLDAGVKVVEYPQYLHGKLLLADDVAVVGSMNLSVASMSKSRELAARFHDPEAVSQVERFFTRAFEVARPVESAQLLFDKIGWLTKVRKFTKFTF